MYGHAVFLASIPLARYGKEGNAMKIRERSIVMTQDEVACLASYVAALPSKARTIAIARNGQNVLCVIEPSNHLTELRPSKLAPGTPDPRD